MSKLKVPNRVILHQSDYTFYYPRPEQAPNPPDSSDRQVGSDEPADNILDAAQRATGGREPYTSSFSYTLESEDSKEHIRDGRLMAVSCFRAGYWSITVRSKNANRKIKPKPSGKKNRKTNPELSARKTWNVESGYNPSTKYYEDALFSVKDICEVLKKLLFDSEEASQGAIIVTGATASAKSQITMGLIHDYMVNCVNQYKRGKLKRKPHLVTIEDPIEEWFVPPVSDKTKRQGGQVSDKKSDHFEIEDYLKRKKGPFADWSVDYTPRELKVDVKSVSKALTDALRQTPSAVFISEIRKDGWKDLLNFAGTGHLVFATGHAGSLAEAMRKILKEMDAATPAARAEVAERILGLIHVRREVLIYDDAGEPKEYPALMVTLWRRIGAGKHGFISDGLAALSPQAPESEGMSAFGRHWFAQTLLDEPCKDIKAKRRRKKCKDTLLRRGRELDLEGL